MIRDRNIDWARKRVYYGALDLQYPKTAKDTDETIVGAGTGDVILAEISTSGIVGWRLEATGDLIHDIKPLPWDFDSTQPLYIRVYWSSDSNTTTDDVTILAKYKKLSNGTAAAAGNTALDTAIPEDRLIAQYGIMKTGWGKINANKLTAGEMYAWQFNVSATDVTIASEYIYFIGYELEYTPFKCYAEVGQMVREAQRRLSV